MAGSAISALKRRLQKLEESHVASAMIPYGLARFVDPEVEQTPEPRAVECQGRRFVRDENETFEQFVSRVTDHFDGEGDGGLLMFELLE